MDQDILNVKCDAYYFPLDKEFMELSVDSSYFLLLG